MSDRVGIWKWQSKTQVWLWVKYCAGRDVEFWLNHFRSNNPGYTYNPSIRQPRVAPQQES